MSVMTANSVPLEPTRQHGGDADHEATPAGQPGQQRRQGQPDARGPGRGRGDGGQFRVLVPDGPDVGVGGAEGDELRRALGEVDHGRAEVTPHVRRTALPGAEPATR